MALKPSYKPFTPTAQQVGPNGIYEFMRQIWTPEILEHKFAQHLLLDAFQPEIEDGWMDNLAVSHSARLTYKKWMNPLKRVRVAALQYDEEKTCPKRLKIDCTIPPAGPLDTYEQCDVDFRFEYSIRVDTCVKTKKLTLDQAEKEWAANVEAVTYRRAIDAWTALAEQIIAQKKTILIPAFTNKLGGHNYFDATTADFYTTASNVFNYLGRAFGRRFKSEFLITIHPDLALEIEQDHSDLLRYDYTGIKQDWLNVDQSQFGGFDTLPSLPRWRGLTILIAPDDIAMHNDTPEAKNFNPWENEDGTKVRMIIASRRSFFTKTVQLMDKTMFPATAQNAVESMVEIWLGGDKLLWPEETFLVEFDRR